MSPAPLGGRTVPECTSSCASPAFSGDPCAWAIGSSAEPAASPHRAPGPASARSLHRVWSRLSLLCAFVSYSARATSRGRGLARVTRPRPCRRVSFCSAVYVRSDSPVPDLGPDRACRASCSGFCAALRDPPACLARSSSGQVSGVPRYRSEVGRPGCWRSGLPGRQHKGCVLAKAACTFPFPRAHTCAGESLLM